MSRSQRELCGLALALLLVCACNPFAPKLDEGPSQSKFGDPTNIEGYFQAFKYAYEFRDTTLYGGLLSPSFTFSYRNYDRGLDLEWGRDEEVRTTGSLFQNSQAISLLWGNIIDSSGSIVGFDITRTFSLDITFNPGDIEHVDGRAVFHLERDKPGTVWRAVRWRDESNL